MHTTSSRFLTAALLAASALNCGSDSSTISSAEYEQLTHADYVNGSDGSTTPAPAPNLVGRWAGTWRTSVASTNSGTMSIVISDSGAVTGELTTSGLDDQEQGAHASLVGRVTGSLVTFMYKFADHDQVLGVGTLEPAPGGCASMGFSLDGDAGDTGAFDICGESHLKPRVLDSARDPQ